MAQKKSMKIKKSEVLEVLKKLGEQIYMQLVNEDFPYVKCQAGLQKIFTMIKS